MNNDKQMREAFEREAAKTGRFIFTRDGNDDEKYWNSPTQHAWEGFQLAWQSQQAQGHKRMASIETANKVIKIGAQAERANAKSNSCDGSGGTRETEEFLRLRSEIMELISPPAPVAVPTGFRNSATGDHWPTIGEKYLIKIGPDLTLQQEVYEFDQGDDGMGGGDYFWSRDDVDECPMFIPDHDEWMPLSEAEMVPNLPAPVAVPGPKTWHHSTGANGHSYCKGWNECREAMLAAVPADKDQQQAALFRAHNGGED